MLKCIDADPCEILFFTLTGKPTAALACLGLPEFFSVQPVGLPVDIYRSRNYDKKSKLSLNSLIQIARLPFNNRVQSIISFPLLQIQRAKHVVLFHLPAQYGSEAILRHIYEMSGAKWRIHVDPRKFGDYLCSDDLGDCTDSDPDLAQWIHACSWDKGDDDRRAARKKRSGAHKFFPREIPCQGNKKYEVKNRMFLLASKVTSSVANDYRSN